LAVSSNLQANTLPLLGWEPTVQNIRVFALLGLGLSLGGLMILGFYVFTTARQSQEALIRLRYGALLVNVYERNLEPASTLIDVTTIDELAKLAERHNTMILHMTLNFLHFYLVQCNGTTYRYVISTGKSGIAETESAHKEIIRYAIDLQENSIAEAESSPEELFGYVINTNKIKAAKARPTETEILRKIRI